MTLALWPNAVVEYGRAHLSELPSPGCIPKSYKYAIELDAKGNFLAISKSDGKKIVCPDCVDKTTGKSRYAQPVMDRAKTSIQMPSGDTGEKLERLEAKRENFLELFRDGAKTIPEFQTVLNALGNLNTLNAIQAEAVNLKVKPDDVITFSVDGTLLANLITVRRWWADRKYAEQNADDSIPYSIDIFTGEECKPARLTKKIPIESIGGTQTSGVAVITFDKPSFNSYGQTQCYNAPMSQETADIISDTLTLLGRRAPMLGKIKFIHWYDQDIEQNDDPLYKALFADNLTMFEDLKASDNNADDTSSTGSTEKRTKTARKAKTNPDMANALADKLVRAPITGTCPPNLANYQYRVLIPEPNGGRAGFSQFLAGSYDELYKNISAWFEDLDLVTANGTGKMPPRKMHAMLYALLSASETEGSKSPSEKMAPLNPHIQNVILACVENMPIPAALRNRAIQANTTSIYKKNKCSPIAIQWLKLYLCREERRKGTQYTMPELNREHPNILYHCGRLMAAYERVQAIVMPDVKAGVLTKFYTAGAQSPAKTIGMMQSMAVHHFAKMAHPGYHKLLTTILEEIWSDIKTPLPKNTKMDDRAYFALGYWQQRADINRRIKEMRAEWAAKKKAGENDTAEENEENAESAI